MQTKKNNHERKLGFFLSMMFLILLISCRHHANIEKTYEMPDANWSYEQKVVTFDVDISDVSCPYRIDLEAEHTGITTPKVLTIEVTVIDPGGGEASKKAGLTFVPAQTQDSHIAIGTLYKERFFNTPGKYKIEIYRKYEKYDLRGIKLLKLKLVPLRE